MKLNSELKARYDAIGRARQALNKAIKKRYPAGSTVIYRKGVRRLAGTVLDHALTDERIKVRAERTQAVYWINASDTVEP